MLSGVLSVSLLSLLSIPEVADFHVVLLFFLWICAVGEAIRTRLRKISAT
jgi:hypothetical protein